VAEPQPKGFYPQITPIIADSSGNENEQNQPKFNLC